MDIVSLINNEFKSKMIQQPQTPVFADQYLFNNTKHQSQITTKKSQQNIKIQQLDQKIKFQQHFYDSIQTYQSDQYKCKLKKMLFINHNIQKYLITTIKQLNLLQVMKKHSEVGTTYQTAKIIWDDFKTNKSRAKQVLMILFGVEQREGIKLKIIIQKYKFKNLLKIQESQILQAQKVLRQCAIKIMEKLNWNQYLSNRKLQDKQILISYMMNFKMNLQLGGLRKRIKSLYQNFKQI